MRTTLILAIAVAGIARTAIAQPQIDAATRAAADRLIDAALADSAAWNRIALLTDKFGARFSGTPALERAIDWVLAEMRKDSLENVRGEPVKVPNWIAPLAYVSPCSGHCAARLAPISWLVWLTNVRPPSVLTSTLAPSESPVQAAPWTR